MVRGITVLCALLLAAEMPAAEPAPPLTTAAAVLALPADQAGGRLPVRVSGIVTAAEPDWNGQFFVQDPTGGIFVENINRPAPAPGDVVMIDGVTHPGAFAPIISAPRWQKTGVAPLPEAKPVVVEDFMAGADDSQRVEITGIVRAARIEQKRLVLDLTVVGNRVQVFARVPAGRSAESLVAARVRIRGTAASYYIGALRHLTSVAVYAPRPEDLTVLEAEQANPFNTPVTPVSEIGQYRPGRSAGVRVHVRGVASIPARDGGLFLQDPTGGIRVEGAGADVLSPGDPVDAIGFVDYEGHLPLLRDAVLRRGDGDARRLQPREVPFAGIARGEHHGELITLRGRIIDRYSRPLERPAGVLTTWLVQNPDRTFALEQAATQEDPALAALPIGSVIEASGVCVLSVDSAGKLLSLRLLLAEPSAVRVLARPSWLTPGRLLAGLGVVSVVLVIAIAWLLTIARKNAVLHRVVRELEVAQGELQEAHDTLEEKVAERTAQLQVEMTARKTAEVQFRAVLAERTRLARDLHDTLEQTLTGIALRLNASAKLTPRDPEAAQSHLQLARNWLHQSQVDLRRSIWDLRSRELEQFSLPEALRHSAEQLVHGSEMRLDFQADAQPPGLPEVVEENLLRLGQEALTNIAKHAAARRVTVRLEFPPQMVRLLIEDDGRGFDRSASPADGHFGLAGMAERAKRIAGKLEITSALGQGTRLLAEIPLAATEKAADTP